MQDPLTKRVSQYREKEKSILDELDKVSQELHQQNVGDGENSFENIYSRLAKENYEKSLKTEAKSLVSWAKQEGTGTLDRIPQDILLLGVNELEKKGVEKQKPARKKEEFEPTMG